MGVDKKFLSETYSRMADQELLSIVSNDIKDLTEEAKEVLFAELSTRGLGKGIDNVIAIQQDEFLQEKLDEYIEIIAQMPCPYCSATINKLNAAFVIINRYEVYIIGCPPCLKREAGSEAGNNVLIGLLGGVSGAIKAANQFAAWQNLVKQIDANQPSDALVSFIKKRIGEIELYRDNPERLAALIKNPNAVFF